MTAPPAMLDAATRMLERAYAPYSQFYVGCCIQGDNQKLYLGCNVENASYPLTQCAEAVAIGAMVADGCNKIDAALIITKGNHPISPCGACRQQLSEFSNGNTFIYSCATENICLAYHMNELLPFTFSKDNLNHKPTP
jgi:cytidine deaminase